MEIMRAFKSNRILKALTGLTKVEFDSLVMSFESSFQETINLKKRRKRAAGAGRRGILKNTRERLFFILFYLKVYPTYDLVAFLVGSDKAQPCRWVKQLLPILEKALGRSCTLPKRQIRSVEEFIKYFPEVKDIFIDGTERRVRRPKSAKNQKKRYSGKKKMHTRKNVIATDENKRILFVSSTKDGRRHDKRLLDKSCFLSGVPPGTTVWVDTGFQGIEQSLDADVSVMRPTKRARKKSLTPHQKQENKTISSIRIVVENAIAGIKRFASLVNLYRNRNGQDDKFFFIASALWNFHLQFV